jgi:hypothetical protein
MSEKITVNGLFNPGQYLLPGVVAGQPNHRLDGIGCDYCRQLNSRIQLNISNAKQ